MTAVAQSAPMKQLNTPIIDIGVNLSGATFQQDIAEVIERAVEQGVSHMIVTGTSLQHSEAAIELCERWPDQLLCTAGVHPHHASEWSDRVGYQIQEFSQHPAVRAIGECGLDFNRNFSTPDEQRHCFEAQLELAADVALPVFLHQRDAHADFLQCMTHWRPRLVGGVAHCFTGSAAEARDYLELELKIGVTGWLCDERRGQSLQQAVVDIPIDQLMIETDAPYLLPRDLPPDWVARLKDRRNEPMLLPHVCEALARYKQMDTEDVARHTTQVAKQLFAIDD